MMRVKGTVQEAKGKVQVAEGTAKDKIKGVVDRCDRSRFHNGPLRLRHGSFLYQRDVLRGHAMRLFACDNCDQVVHFDNRQCVRCNHRLGFLPDDLSMRSLEPRDGDFWQLDRQPATRCASAPMPASISATGWSGRRRPTNSASPAATTGWCRISIPRTASTAGAASARRNAICSIRCCAGTCRRPIAFKDPQGGLVFDFLEDEVQMDGNVIPAMTGHDEGVIAIRAAEADDLTRELARASMNEPYRTLLGHFRHEVGHFVWNKLVRDRNGFDGFRAVFGDERQDYGIALQNHYQNGAPLGWQQNFISAYATAHPWEDFAECFAHYLHIVDTLETARGFGIAIDPRGHEEMASEVDFDPYRAADAEQLVSAWVPLSVAINAIQRSMGQPDSYPFVLSNACRRQARISAPADPGPGRRRSSAAA
jgi:hypothetical protein